MDLQAVAGAEAAGDPTLTKRKQSKTLFYTANKMQMQTEDWVFSISQVTFNINAGKDRVECSPVGLICICIWIPGRMGCCYQLQT